MGKLTVNGKQWDTDKVAKVYRDDAKSRMAQAMAMADAIEGTRMNKQKLMEVSMKMGCLTGEANTLNMIADLLEGK